MERSSRYVYNIMYTHIHSHLQGTTPSSSSHSSDELTLSEVHTPHTLHTITLFLHTVHCQDEAIVAGIYCGASCCFVYGTLSAQLFHWTF